MAGIITATGAAEWQRVAKLELLSSVEAACWLRISAPAFYAGAAKRLPVIRPAGPRSNAFYLMSDLVAYVASTREVPAQPAA